jgi:hypothetical protein
MPGENIHILGTAYYAIDRKDFEKSSVAESMSDSVARVGTLTEIAKNLW